MSDHFPFNYDAAYQAKKDADAISSLRFITKLSELSNQRQKAIYNISRELESAHPATMRANIMGQHCQGIQGRLLDPPLFPLKAPLPPRVPAGTNQLSPRLRSTFSSNRIKTLFLQASPDNEHSTKYRNSLAMCEPTEQQLLDLHHRTAAERASLLSHDGTRNDALSSITLDVLPSEVKRILEEKSYFDARSKKVQAALQSQHQRGKKRSELNDLERLELTRSRNREHARSTRIRKKARHDDLLECERLLKTLRDSQNLAAERVNCLQRYFRARQDMLNSSISAASSSDTKSSGGADIACESSLRDSVVDPLETFNFDTRGLGETSATSSVRSDSPLLRMRNWDEQLRLRVSEEGVFVYEIEDGIDGFAISNKGIAYAQIELVFYKTPETAKASTKHGTVLLKGMIRAQFSGPSSCRLSSVVSTVIVDNCGTRPFRGIGAIATPSY